MSAKCVDQGIEFNDKQNKDTINTFEFQTENLAAKQFLIIPDKLLKLQTIKIYEVQDLSALVDDNVVNFVKNSKHLKDLVIGRMADFDVDVISVKLNNGCRSEDEDDFHWKVTSHKTPDFLKLFIIRYFSLGFKSISI